MKHVYIIFALVTWWWWCGDPDPLVATLPNPPYQFGWNGLKGLVRNIVFVCTVRTHDRGVTSLFTIGLVYRNFPLRVGGVYCKIWTNREFVVILTYSCMRNNMEALIPRLPVLYQNQVIVRILTRPLTIRHKIKTNNRNHHANFPHISISWSVVFKNKIKHIYMTSQ